MMQDFVGHPVVVDLDGGYLALGTVAQVDQHHLVLVDADLHDHAEANCTKEVYVIDSVKIGVRANRRRVLLPLVRVIAVSRLSDVVL